jgi:lysophospholipase L1-like esterase
MVALGFYQAPSQLTIRRMYDRRNFLKSCAVAAGAAGISNQSAQAEAPINPSGVSGYHYLKPSFKKGSRLLFQGDSITDMKWGRNQKDRNHYLGHSYVYLIAARLGVEIPGDQLDFYNRGMSGHSVANLRGRWQKDALEMKPDLLSILIGTNDVNQGATPEAFESDYRYILDASLKANSELRLVLLDPFVLRVGRLADEKSWAERRAATDSLRAVVARLAKDYETVHVKTQDVFDAAAQAVTPEHWIWDGIHPLPQGHELIARNWLQEVSSRWPHQ